MKVENSEVGMQADNQSLEPEKPSSGVEPFVSPLGVPDNPPLDQDNGLE